MLQRRKKTELLSVYFKCFLVTSLKNAYVLTNIWIVHAVDVTFLQTCICFVIYIYCIFYAFTYSHTYLCIVIYSKVCFSIMSRGNFRVNWGREKQKRGMKWFPADSSGMLIPKNTSLPPPPPPTARNAAAGYNWLQDGAREDERMRERWSDKKDGEGGDVSEEIWFWFARLSSSFNVEKKKHRRNSDFQFSVWSYGRCVNPLFPPNFRRKMLDHKYRENSGNDIWSGSISASQKYLKQSGEIKSLLRWDDWRSWRKCRTSRTC